MADFNSPLYRTITAEVARSLYCQAWASAAEEAGHSLAGKKIEDEAPDTPDFAFHHAAYVIGAIEQHHGLSIASIYSQACTPDCKSYDEVLSALSDDLPDERRASTLVAHVREFGFCIGLMATGSGASWFDNHEKFDLNDGVNHFPFKVPHTEFYIDKLPPPLSRHLPRPMQSSGLEPGR